MANNYSGSLPHFPHGEQHPVAKMPAAMPNGAPPQWGHEVDFKSNLTSQIAPPVLATNGTRSSSQHSHPGSLSSHSSRDSSPAPSRIGVVHPNAWSASNSHNHSNLVPNDSPSSISNRAQQPAQLSPFSSGGPTVTNHSASLGQEPVSNFQSTPGQRMPPIGQMPSGPQQMPAGPQQMPAGPQQMPAGPQQIPVGPQQMPAGPQQMPAGSFPPSLQRPQGPVASTPSSTLGQPVPQVSTAANNFASSSASHTSAGNPLYTPAPSLHTQGQQPQGNFVATSSSAGAPLQNSFAAPSQYSQAPSHQVGTTGQQQSFPNQGSPRPMGQAFPMQAAPTTQATAAHVLPMQVQTNSSPMPSAQLNHGPLTGRQMPLGAGQPMPPSSAAQGMPGQQMPPMPGQQLSMMGPRPSGPGQQMQPQPGFGPIMPLGPGQNIPPGSQIQPGFSQQMPPRSGQQMQPARVPQLPPMSAGPPGPIPPRQMLTGPAMYSQRPPAGPPLTQGPPQGPPQGSTQGLPQGPPLGSLQGPPQGSAGPTGQWPSGPTALGLPSRPAYPMHQGLATSHQGPQPYPGQQPMNMPNLPQPSQSLSGPALQRPLQPLGQEGHYMPNAGQPIASGPLANDMGLRRYPQQMHPTGPDSLTAPMSNLSVTQAGYNKLWGQEHYDLLQSRNILPPEKVEAPKIRLTADFQNSVNCSPDIFRCTLTRIPETDSLLKKSRLPLGVLIHPFRDLHNLPVIQCTPIVRCRICRTYINPFVYFMDEKHWKCNLCFRVNELPDEFHYDPATKTYGEPMRRPEVKSATIEFIAPAEYMLRPPQPAVYLFLLDVSRLAVESGYLQVVCETLLTELEHLPGDGRTSVGFITYDSAVHFYSLAEGLSAPQQMVVMDIDEIFLPCPENLLANLGERKELIQNLLLLLPTKFSEQYDTGSALGAALQAAFKLMSPTGGRVTVFQCCLPNKGPGTLKAREDPANRASKDVPHLNPATDFYKQLALEFSGQQTAVDLFLLNQQYSDLATISGVSRFSGGCIYHFPLFQSSNIQLCDSFETAFRRYLERKIGFEAVMRIRCSRGLSIHTFHGNFYVRSTDLLSLPNINPDAGFGMQVSIEENLSDMQSVCFQAALLYTSGKGERRIRVHTICLPTANSLPDILHSADQQCIIGLLAKMAVDRSQQSSLSDARDAFINVAIDALSAYKLTQSSVTGAGLLAPRSLRLLPLYIVALLKNVAFRSGTTTRLDDRVFAMCQMKTLPLSNLIQFIYPDMYPVYALDQYEEVMVDDTPITIPPRLHLSAEKVSSQGAFLLDAGDQMLLLVGRAIPPIFCENVLGVSSFSAIPEDMFELPEIDCEDSRRLRNFVSYLHSEKPYCATLHVIREDSKQRSKFFERLIEDRTDSSLSYYEFLQHLKNQIK